MFRDSLTKLDLDHLDPIRGTKRIKDATFPAHNAHRRERYVY